MSPERKKEIDMILRKTEEDMKREDFDPMKAGIPLDEFLKIQAKKREIRHQKKMDTNFNDREVHFR